MDCVFDKGATPYLSPYLLKLYHIVISFSSILFFYIEFFP